MNFLIDIFIEPLPFSWVSGFMSKAKSFDKYNSITLNNSTDLDVSICNSSEVIVI